MFSNLTHNESFFFCWESQHCEPSVVKWCFPSRQASTRKMKEDEINNKCQFPTFETEAFLTDGWQRLTGPYRGTSWRWVCLHILWINYLTLLTTRLHVTWKKTGGTSNFRRAIRMSVETRWLRIIRNSSQHRITFNRCVQALKNMIKCLNSAAISIILFLQIVLGMHSTVCECVCLSWFPQAEQILCIMHKKSCKCFLWGWKRWEFWDFLKNMFKPHVDTILPQLRLPTKSAPIDGLHLKLDTIQTPRYVTREEHLEEATFVSQSKIYLLKL